VTVTDATGTTVAGDAGTGQEIDWTWDASTAPPGLYSWTIGAGDTVRPATGRLGAKPVPLKITAAAASPRTVTPNGDGQTDSSQISYTLSAPATVTASLRAPDGTQLAVLFSEARPAGKQAFRFVPTDIPDGRYDIVLTAVDPLTTVSAVLPVLVDRTVGRFTAAPAAVSPNGDGVLDDLTFSFELTRAASVRLEVARAGKTVAAVYSAELPGGAQTLDWNGAGVPDGRYAGVLTATNEIGTVRHTALFAIDTTAPQLRAISFRRLRFTVSEPAAIRLVLNGKRITRTVRAGSFSFRASRVRSVRIVARDAAGNVSRTLRYR